MLFLIFVLKIVWCQHYSVLTW